MNPKVPWIDFSAEGFSSVMFKEGGDVISLHPLPSEIPVAGKIEETLDGAIILYISYGRPIGIRSTSVRPKATYCYDKLKRLLAVRFECKEFFSEWLSMCKYLNKQSNTGMVAAGAAQLVLDKSYSHLNRNISSKFRISGR